jgi:hypothetical protein
VLRRGARGQAEGVPGAEVIVQALEGEARFRAGSGARGAFDLTLPEGRYTVTARLGDVATDPQPLAIAAGTPQRLDLTLPR